MNGQPDCRPLEAAGVGSTWQVFFLTFARPFRNASKIILLGQGVGSALVFLQVISVPTHSWSDFHESIFVPSIASSDLHFVLAGPSFLWIMFKRIISVPTLWGGRTLISLGRASTSLDHV